MKKVDTIALINKLQEDAHNAIHTQELDNALPKLIQAKRLAKEINSPTHKALVSATLSYFYYSVYSYELAAKECTRAIGYIKEETSSVELGKVYNLYGL
ncbi:MAG: hypothetical protein H0X63_12730, partial [Flavobacteriales bacterium]|nr:hypothetical protein [Flavobacteriales bacterium]